MSQNYKAKQPIFGYDVPKIQKPTPTASITMGGRSAAISSMIKKSDFDLMSLEKNPFGNYRNMLPNNTSRYKRN